MVATVSASESPSLSMGQRIESVSAPMRTLDSFALREIGFIKIDVEGHEEAVLKGAVRTLRQEQPNMLVEIEERHSRGSLQRVVTLLGDNDYTGFYLDSDKVLNINQFDPIADQPVSNVSADHGKVGRYINNFMFFPRRSAADMVQKLRLICGNK